jgi:hypothetical protein
VFECVKLLGLLLQVPGKYCLTRPRKYLLILCDSSFSGQGESFLSPYLLVAYYLLMPQNKTRLSKMLRIEYNSGTSTLLTTLFLLVSKKFVHFSQHKTVILKSNTRRQLRVLQRSSYSTYSNVA